MMQTADGLQVFVTPTFESWLGKPRVEIRVNWGSQFDQTVTVEATDKAYDRKMAYALAKARKRRAVAEAAKELARKGGWTEPDPEDNPYEDYYR